MAGDWIPMRLDVLDDPAVVAMAATLGMDEYAVVGRLLKLWTWANKHLKDGVAKNVTEAWIDRYLDTKNFAAAMLSVGWLLSLQGGVEFANFDRWNSQGAKIRLGETLRKRANRKKTKPPKVSRKCPDKVPDTFPDVSGTNVRNCPVPEKRREESKNPPSEGAAPPPDEPEKPKVGSAPRKEPDGIHHEYIRVFVDAWSDRYPNEKYPFNGGKDGTAAKWFRDQTSGNLEKFKAVVARFMDDDDEFIAGHDMGKLRSNFARWLVERPAGAFKPNAGGFQTQDARTAKPILQVLERQRDRQNRETAGGGGQPAALPAPRLADTG